MTKVEKADFVRILENLKRLADRQTRELWLKMHWENGIGCYYSSVKDFDESLQHDFVKERLKWQQELVKLQHEVSHFHTQLIDIKPSPEVIEMLQTTMVGVETSICAFKENQHHSVEELLKEELVCWQEISAFSKKMESWSLDNKSNLETIVHPPRKGERKAQSNVDGVPPEVKTLDAFLQQSGGQCGGWDEFDHLSFLQVRAKHGKGPKFIEKVMPYVPTMSREEVQQHEDWYLKLLDLQDKKKQAILRWRKERQLKKGESLQQREELMAEERRNQEEAAQERHRREEVEKNKLAMRLEEWRGQKQLQREMEEEQRLKELALQKKRAEEERRRQKETSLAVKAHVQLKKEQEEHIFEEMRREAHKQAVERGRVATERIQQFHERDLRKLETKLLDKKQRDHEEAERQMRLDKLKEKVTITRDPSRLYKPTKGWEERTKCIGPSGDGPVYKMFHRAVPSWRQGL